MNAISVLIVEACRRVAMAGVTCRSLVAAATVFAGVLGLGCGSARAGALVAADFESIKPDAVLSDATAGATATHALTADGTIDTYMGQPGQCATLRTAFTANAPQAIAGVTLRLTSAPNDVTDLAKLTVAADVWIDRVRPIGVRLSSFDAGGRVTGSLTGTILPPVANAWYRKAFDLSVLKPGDGKFDPTAVRLELRFQLANTTGEASDAVLRIDNVSLSAPSFYVSASGQDSADGRGEATAFATVQRGIDAAGPGDVVLIMDGTYRNKTIAGVGTFDKKAGSPAKWITVRSAPGHKPRLVNNGWEVFKIEPGSAYLEIRGLDCSGNRANVKLQDALADGVLKEKDGKKYAGDPLFNGNGISAEGRHSPDSASRPHHLRFIDNHVHDNCGGGISAIASDYVTVEGNTVHDNAHYMRYGGSGISFLNLSNFDDSPGHRAFVSNNVLHNNRCYVPWAAVGHLSDGNNIIIDVNRHANTLDGDYRGRTLVSNNLVVGGGGGGITVTTSSRIDIVHNTLYHNVQTDELAKRGWTDLFIGGPPPNAQDIRVHNNIIWSAPGRGIISAGRADNYSFKHNVYFGDPGAKAQKGDAGDAGNKVVNPGLKNPGMRGSIDDFRPTAGSAAVGHALPTYPGVPLADLAGDLRPTGGPGTAGALLAR